MSSKGKRASAATPQPGSSSTPILTGANRPDSPLSPTRLSRVQEKAELQNLNDRLACYIDRVRNLENENARLTLEVHTSRENVNRECTNIKAMYETELSDARKLLDETAREKARLEIDIKRLYEENEELRALLDKKNKDCSIAEGNARMYEARAADLSNKYNAANADRKKALDELNDLKKDCERLRQQLQDARKMLEEETLARVDLENSVQSLREELTFKDQVHVQEVNETRSRRQVDITEIDGRLSEQYEMKLQQSLQELRDQYESQMLANRKDIEALYETKIRNLQDTANRSASHASGMSEELRITRSKVDGLNLRINELESQNASLSARIRDLEQMIDNERMRHNDEIAHLQDELQRMRDEQAQQIKDYQDLMETKISLDLEIAAYDKLLRGEESRLHITPSKLSEQASSSSFSSSQNVRSTRTPSRKTPTRGGSLFGGVKRKRTVIDESEELSQAEFFVTGNAKGDIEIGEVDAEGKFVKLHNKGNKEIAIGGWQIVRKAAGKETSYKLHRTVKIAAGATITIWSMDVQGITHEPPTNIVMKSQKWVTADDMKTQLYNSDGEEVAGSERIKRIIATQSSRQRMGRGGYSAVDGEQLYHQQGDPNSKENCSIM